MAYLWRKLSPEQRQALLAWRRRRHHPWHSPPHAFQGRGTYLLTAACLRHAFHLGRTPERLGAFSNALLGEVEPMATGLHAWCVLPNHYHIVISTTDLRRVTRALGKLHGRTSRDWNREESTPGRQVWHAASDRYMRSERHFLATLNYVHHNPVRHGYVTAWEDWPYSSARDYLETVGRVEADRIWREYPLGTYGDGWDNAEW